MRRSIPLPALLALCVLGCKQDARIGSDCPDDGPCLANAASLDDGPTVPAAPARSGGVEKVDILFVVDDSGSMAEEQAALTDQLPRMLEVLRTGDTDGGGQPEFQPVTDLHVGVVSTNLGIVGVDGIDLCMGLGDEARLLAGEGCLTGDLTFVDTESYQEQAAAGEAMQCVATLGTMGCGFESQLESALKALWPANDTSLEFAQDPTTGFGALGQGGDPQYGGENAGFLREDSLLIVVLITDEEDCSREDTSILRPPQYLDPTVSQDLELAAQGLNVRCHHNPDALYEVERYIDGLKALRAYDDLVMFFAIAGVPPETVDDATVAAYDLEDTEERDAFYDAVLAHPMMQEEVIDNGTPDPQDDEMRPSCDTAIGVAYPPRRILEVTRAFGVNGMVQSICQDDLNRPMSSILRTIGRRLGAPEP